GADVHPLHRGGRAPRRLVRADVARPGDRLGQPRRTGGRARRGTGGRALRAARTPRRGGGTGPYRRTAHSPDRALGVGAEGGDDAAVAHCGTRPGRGLPRGQPRGRLRRPDRREGRMIETAALGGIWRHEFALFKRYYLSQTFAALVEPTVMLQI